MSAVLPPKIATATDVGLAARRTSRGVRSGVATGLMAASLLVVMVPLVFVLVTVVQKGASVFSWGFLTKDIVPSRRAGGGMGPAVVGTLVTTGMASLMAVPLGVLGAIYLNEYGSTGRLPAVLRFFADVMTGVPSIVMGLFVSAIWVVRFGTDGISGFAGALALGALMLPIVIRSTEEMLKLVPDQLREASFALGTGRARTITSVVFPPAFPGILSGVLLAVARAAGETAPLLFTIGAATQVNWDVFNGPNTALSAQIFTNAQLPYPAAQARAWGAALTLILLSFVLMILARIVASRFDPARRR